MNDEMLRSGFVTDIADEALSFTARVEEEAIERWGFTREQLEADLQELKAYRAMGAVEELAARVEVVRCGECKYSTLQHPWPGGQEKIRVCHTPATPFHNWSVPEDGFCHKGKRRED